MNDTEIRALMDASPCKLDAESGNWVMDLRPTINQTVAVHARDEQEARSLIVPQAVPGPMRDPVRDDRIAELQQKVGVLETDVTALQEAQ